MRVKNVCSVLKKNVASLCLCTLVFRKSNLIGRERWRLQRSEISFTMERKRRSSYSLHYFHELL